MRRLKRWERGKCSSRAHGIIGILIERGDELSVAPALQRAPTLSTWYVCIDLHVNECLFLSFVCMHYLIVFNCEYQPWCKPPPAQGNWLIHWSCLPASCNDFAVPLSSRRPSLCHLFLWVMGARRDANPCFSVCSCLSLMSRGALMRISWAVKRPR